MVDTVAILFSTLACLFFMLRAARADREGLGQATDLDKTDHPPQSAEKSDGSPPWKPAWDGRSGTEAEFW